MHFALKKARGGHYSWVNIRYHLQAKETALKVSASQNSTNGATLDINTYSVSSCSHCPSSVPHYASRAPMKKSRLPHRQAALKSTSFDLGQEQIPAYREHFILSPAVFSSKLTFQCLNAYAYLI